MTPAQILEPHRHRIIRCFLIAPDIGNHKTGEVIRAFWDLVYQGFPSVGYETAVAIETELTHTDLTVGDLLDGWRPIALTNLPLPL